MTMKTLMGKMMMASCALAVTMSASMAMNEGGDEKAIEKYKGDREIVSHKGPSFLQKFKQDRQNKLQRFREHASDRELALQKKGKELGEAYEGAMVSMDEHGKTMDRFGDSAMELSEMCSSLMGQAIMVFKNLSQQVKEADERGAEMISIPYSDARKIVHLLQQRMIKGGKEMIEGIVNDIDSEMKENKEFVEMTLGQAKGVQKILSEFGLTDCL